MKYNVGIREIHVTWFQVEAKSSEQAKEFAQVHLSIGEHKNVTDLEFTEYSRTLDQDKWSIE